jgi:putative NADPH-quinone reductase
MNLAEMEFDLGIDGFGDGSVPLEPDLAAWQQNVAWADHLFVVHPYWWGAMPTRAKAVLDRGLTPRFAFKYHQRGVAWDKLLTGKTADAVITSDTPPLLDTLLYGRPGRRVLKNQVLGFCGIKTKRLVQFGSVKLAKPEKIARWLESAATMGARAAA